MPDKTIHISSSSQFSSSLASSTYNVVDFHATWCGPCKTIAPVFHALAEKETKPGKIQFLKVDVDACQDIARKHGVSAMPTFLVFKSGSVVETIRGANPSALTAAVRKAANDSASGPASRGAYFSSKGYTLGSANAPSQPANNGILASVQGMISGNGGFGDKVVRFFALYFVSLLAFDGFKAAEESPFSIRGRR